MSVAQIKVRNKCFEDGGESVENDPHSGRPATRRTPENVEHVLNVYGLQSTKISD